MHFHSKRENTITDNERVTLPNSTIVSPGTRGLDTDTVRWVGIWFDRKLSFRHHVKLKAASAMRAMGAIQRLANCESGLSPKAVRQLYNSCVIPISDFGAEIWWNGQKGYATKLETVQNSALRKILGAFRTTPIVALQTEAALPPVHVRLQHAQRRYAIRILTMPKDHPIRRQCPVTFPPNHWYELDLAPEDKRWRKWNEISPTNKPFCTRLIRILSYLNEWIEDGSEVEQYSLEDCPPWAETLVQTRISHKTKEAEAKAHVKQAALLSQRTRNLLTYTDGSMLADNVGAGVYISPGSNQPAIENTYPLGTQMEVYDAELYGIRQAAEHALKFCRRTRKRRDIWIFTDNQAAVMRVATLKPGPGQEIAIAVSNASHILKELNHSTITVQWVPGHTNIPGNEAADRLAKEATKQKSRTATKTSLAYLKRMARLRMREEWRRWWDTTEQKGHEYFGQFRVKPDKIFEMDNRSLISTVTQLRTGHGYFNSYLQRIPTSQIEDRGCSCNGAPPQTPAHLILRCPRYKAARALMRQETSRIPKLRIDLLLYTNMGANAMAQYIRRTGVATRQWMLGTRSPTDNTVEKRVGWGTLGQPHNEHHSTDSSGESEDEIE
jgi:ribonuclease HI